MKVRDDWQFRGLIHQTTDEGVFDRLDAGSVTLYVGFDPTASSLHLGSLIPLLNMRRLQMAGNAPIALAGGGTGLVGDPSFKDAERPLLTPRCSRRTSRAYGCRWPSFLDFEPSAGTAQATAAQQRRLAHTVSLTDFLRDVGKHFTVNQMIAKESVKSRLDRDDVGLSFTEFSYMLLQAYDFLRLYLDEGCTLQLGGSDQWGNITVGRRTRAQVGGRQRGCSDVAAARARRRHEVR